PERGCGGAALRRRGAAAGAPARSASGSPPSLAHVVALDHRGRRDVVRQEARADRPGAGGGPPCMEGREDPGASLACAPRARRTGVRVRRRLTPAANLARSRAGGIALRAGPDPRPRETASLAGGPAAASNVGPRRPLL